MVQKISIVDDLTDDEGAETHTFSFDNGHYTIDLTPENWALLLEHNADYINAARPLRNGYPSSPKVAARASAKPGTALIGRDSTQLAAVRDWWRAQGNEVSDRGRIAGHIMDAYDTAHKGKSAGKQPAFSHA